MCTQVDSLIPHLDILSKIKKHSQEHAEKSFTGTIIQLVYHYHIFYRLFSELINNLTSSANDTESKDGKQH